MKGKIVTLTAPPGAGKGYVKPHIIAYLDATDIPVYTTRKPRTSSDNSRIFISDEEFQRRLEKGELVFVNELFGHRYAFDAGMLGEAGARDGYSVAEVHIDNAAGFRSMFPYSNMIALLAGSQELLMQRLTRRGDDAESIRLRMQAAGDETKKILESTAIFDFMHTVDPNNEALSVPSVMKYMEDYYALSRRTNGPDVLG